LLFPSSSSSSSSSSSFLLLLFFNLSVTQSLCSPILVRLVTQSVRPQTLVNGSAARSTTVKARPPVNASQRRPVQPVSPARRRVQPVRPSVSQSVSLSVSPSVSQSVR
jgi:hypothetical protein